MTYTKIYLAEISTALFDAEHPSLPHNEGESDESMRARMLKEWKKDLQKKHFRPIFFGLGLLSEDFERRVRDTSNHNQYFFPREAEPLLKKILGKEYRNKFHRLIKGKGSFPFTCTEVIEFSRGLYDLHINLGFTPYETQQNMKKALEILHFQESCAMLDRLNTLREPLTCMVRS